MLLQNTFTIANTCCNDSFACSKNEPSQMFTYDFALEHLLLVHLNTTGVLWSSHRSMLSVYLRRQRAHVLS